MPTHTLHQVLHRHHLTHTPLFVACSGGRDSLSLAFACVQLYQLGKLNQLPTLIHIHHGLQVYADEWAMGVANFAKSHQMPCIINHLTLTDTSEQGARAGRYGAFFECVPNGGVLLLAHHQDDQAETVLMRLVNGTGLVGLTAMAEISKKTQNNQTLNIVRPFLALSRATISDYAKSHALPYVDDPTNTARTDTTSQANARAFIRTHLKDLLHALNPQAYANIARTASVLQADNALLQSSIQGDFAKRFCASLSPYVVGLDVADFGKLPYALQIALIRHFAKFGIATSPNHRLSTDLHALATRTDSNHQSELFWQVDGGFVFYLYKSILYRYRLDFWRAVQGDVLWEWQGQLGRFVWQGGAVQVRFGDRVLECTKMDSTSKIPLKNKQLYGKKLYQTLAIAAPYRNNLWRVRTDKGEWVLGVGRAWGDGCEGVQFLVESFG